MADSSSPKKEEQTRGWGGWGFSSAFSVLSDIQKAASNAAGEISKSVCPLVFCRWIRFLDLLDLVLVIELCSLLFRGRRLRSPD